jgi:serine/threonine protein kinase
MGNICAGSKFVIDSVDATTRAAPADVAPQATLKKIRSAKGLGIPIEASHLSYFDYHRVSLMYKGQFGVVYSAVAVDNDCHKVAFKCFGYSQETPELDIINREIELLYALKGVEGVVQIQGVILDSPEGFFQRKKFLNEIPIIVTELLEGESLSRQIRYTDNVSEHTIAVIFRKLLLAVEGLHSKHCLHR